MEQIRELNIIKKNWRRVDLKVALCYPNVYRAGMSGLTVKLLYALLNSREDVLCERFFLPISDEPLRSLESNQPLERFDVIAFTLQYEEDYVNTIKMLLNSNIQLKRERRKGEGPLLIAGGPSVTANPEPLAEYFDLFVIGEAEPLIDQLIDRIKIYKVPSRHAEEFADLEGVYVPEISNPTVKVWARRLDDAPHPIAQQIPLVDDRSPYMPVFGKTFTIEAVRGCSLRCRFCLIGCIGRPKRDRSISRIEEILESGLKYTPVGKVSLIGAGISNYHRLEDLCELIVTNRLELSIPSIRPEAVTEKIARLLAQGKQRTIAMAPDGSSPRIREIIKKMIDDETLIDAADTLLKNGIKRLKLYFMIGLPGESIEDVKSIAHLTKRIADLGFNSKSIHLSINPLIPKAQTPLQWERFPRIEYIRESLRTLKKELKGDKRILISHLDPRHAMIQALLSLGDRRIGEAIEAAARYGGSLGAWRRALREKRINVEEYVGMRDIGSTTPWNHICTNLNRSFLIDEAEDVRRQAGD